MRMLSLLALILLPAFGLAQELSEAEKAAKTQRALTPSERQARDLGCRKFAMGTGKKAAVSAGLVGEIVKTRAFDILLIAQLVQGEASKKSNVRAFLELPNGGIGAKDLCGTITVHPSIVTRRPGSPIKTIGLLLREGLNIDQEYPNTSKEIWDRNQINLFAESWYVALDASDPQVELWVTEKRVAWMKQHGFRDFFEKDNLLFIPIRAPI
ncbi:MAG: hypothetical protein WA782_21310 [Sulfitobacter sp.]